MDKKEIDDIPAVSGPSSSSTEDVSSTPRQKSRGRKRKRRSSSSENGHSLPDNTLETERNVHASAVKNNLDDISVRKILKKVVTNDHVLALVKLREEEEGDSGSDDKSVQPKLTRAKAKELKKGSHRAPWNLDNLELSPIKHIHVKTRPEVKALIAQELPEDEDDEEYEPTHDDVLSDEEHDQSCSDADSQPRTPATPLSQCTPSPKVLRDGPFKVPQDVSSVRRKLNVDEEEATIALRTRSKLSLSTTTIEHIESAFVPPDAVPPPVDDLWSQFLSDCLAPAALHDEDDEADPEYNAAADADAQDDDEDMLASSLIKISKKELNDLVTELFSVMPAADEDLTLETLANSVLTDTSHTEVPRWEGKTEPLSDEEGTERPSKRLTFEKGNSVTTSAGKQEPEMQRPVQQTNHVPCERVEPMYTRSSVRARENTSAKLKKSETHNTTKSPKSSPTDVLHMCIEERITPAPAHNAQDVIPPSLRSQIELKTETVHIQMQNDVLLSQEQVLILQQQLRMHVQLSASNFMQLFVHPLHWRLGPAYKDYLETLGKLSEANENSVVNVCNLRPALDLIRDWEESVSKDTPENVQMVEYINDQVERNRRRYAQNSLYVGDFHDKFKKVVANSSVFLYPYLLPAVPYKADNTKRVIYLRPEDELIVLGLDQFWKYMEDNKDVFKQPKVRNSRHRWGLASALQLVCKHMLPWMTPKQLAAHVTSMRTQADKHNPIYNYLTNNVLPLVQHSLLPFNPELTLYEHPEHEMPRLWARYLAKTSKRFKTFLHRRHHVTGAIPTGVPISGLQATPAAATTTKIPLPHDFTKEIKCTRNPEDPLTDIPESSDKNAEKLNEKTPLNMYKLVNTSTGSFLVPLEIVITDSNTRKENLEGNTKLTVSTKTVTTPAEVTSEPKKIPQPKLVLRYNTAEHCSCCLLLRKIVKKQTVITDYFRKNKEKRKCYCSEVKYPKVNNKLRLLANNFKNHSGLVFDELERRLEDIKSGKARRETDGLGTCTLDELVAVTKFQLKVVSRSLMSKYSYLKVRCKNLLSRFNPDTGDPTRLANALFKTCEEEMLDLYLDFLEFMTIEQVDRINKFKDYFVRNCAKDLMDKVEDQVQDKAARARILSQLKRVFSDNLSSSCEICTSLLETMAGYDNLAEFTFFLFPHRKEARLPGSKVTKDQAGCATQATPVAHIRITQSQEQDNESEDATRSSVGHEDTSTGVPASTEASSVPRTIAETPIQEQASVHESESESQDSMEYEDTSSGTEEENSLNATTMSVDQPKIPEDTEPTPMVIKTEPDTTMDIIDNQIEAPAPTHTFIITLEEELIKEEALEPADWKREDDKLILELLKQQLTPEERRYKTIAEILDEKNVPALISESIAHKSIEEVRERVFYILSLLVQSES